MSVVEQPAVRVTAEEQARVEQTHPYSRILVALDGSTLAEEVLKYVEPLAGMFDSKVTCVCAVEPLSPSALAATGVPGGAAALDSLLEGQEEIRTGDATYLEHVRERLSRLGVSVDCEVPDGRAAEAIVAIARARQVDLIAMTTHGRSGLGRALLGSVADEVVRTAPCPILLVRLSAAGREPSGEGD